MSKYIEEKDSVTDTVEDINKAEFILRKIECLVTSLDKIDFDEMVSEYRRYTNEEPSPELELLFKVALEFAKTR